LRAAAGGGGPAREPIAGELIEAAARRLRAAGSPSPRLDAQLLLEHVTGWSRAELLAHPERALAPQAASAFQSLVRRRAGSEPIAYLTGQREFYGRCFKVDHRALIPRPETELLVDLGNMAVAAWRKRGIEPVVVDVGTGSGAIAVSLAAECGLIVVATDRSLNALLLARENAFHHHARLRLVQTDLLQGLRSPLHVVLANLPYVPSQRTLPPDVADFEPPLALYGGERGTELIERLLLEARPLLAPSAELCLELDEQAQAAPMATLARQLYPSAAITIRRDAGGYERVLHITSA
jgi:release factor glutamine methyltransferase